MKKEYNVPGKKDVKNISLLKKILKLKDAGATFAEIALAVERSPKRVKEIYYKNVVDEQGLTKSKKRV